MGAIRKHNRQQGGLTEHKLTGLLTQFTDRSFVVTLFRQSEADINGPSHAKLLKAENFKMFPVNC